MPHWIGSNLSTRILWKREDTMYSFLEERHNIFFLEIWNQIMMFMIPENKDAATNNEIQYRRRKDKYEAGKIKCAGVPEEINPTTQYLFALDTRRWWAAADFVICGAWGILPCSRGTVARTSVGAVHQLLIQLDGISTRVVAVIYIHWLHSETWQKLKNHHAKLLQYNSV